MFKFLTEFFRLRPLAIENLNESQVAQSLEKRQQKVVSYCNNECTLNLQFEKILCGKHCFCVVCALPMYNTSAYTHVGLV